jgi:hypothetical protein
MNRLGVYRHGKTKRRLFVTVLLFAILLALASAVQSTLALADSVNLCGALREFRAPTATLPGSVTVGSDQFAISPAATQNVGSGATTAGTNVCLTGTWQMSETVGRNLSDFALVVQRSSPQQNLPTTGTTSNDAMVVVLVIGAGGVLGLVLIMSRRRLR